MKLRHLLSLSLLLLVVRPAVWAQQTAEAIFHKGAQLYLDGITNASGIMNPTNHLLASQVVSNGLRTFPTNPYLTNLWALLNRKQQSQQNQDDQKDQSKEDEQKSKEDKPKPDEKENQENSKPDEEQKSEEKKPDSAKDKEPEDKKDKESGQPENQDKQDQENAQDGKTALARMTPQQAQQLLDMQKSEEKAMIFTPQTKMKTNRTNRVFKDW